MIAKTILPIIIGVLVFVGCSPQADKEQADTSEMKDVEANEGFDASGSDPEAVALADSVIEAHGGWDTWTNTRYIGWNFLGVRNLMWDKYTGLVRIDFPKENSTYIINIVQDTGRVKLGNSLIKDQDSLNNYISRGKQMWVNDAYWLVFPFKLKDKGVTLKYIGADTTNIGEKAEVIELTFKDVGFTPYNKYYAYINPDTYLIAQWDYFKNAADSIPAISGIWSDYDEYNGLMLSSGRGDRSLSNIAVSDSLDSAAFAF